MFPFRPRPRPPAPLPVRHPPSGVAVAALVVSIIGTTIGAAALVLSIIALLQVRRAVGSSQQQRRWDGRGGDAGDGGTTKEE